MRLAVAGGWCLIAMLLARILVPIAMLYVFPETALAEQATRLIQFTADSSAVMLVIALFLLWAIRRQWKPGMWLGMAFSLALVVWCGDALFNLLSSLNETPLSRGSLLLPPRPEAKTSLEALNMGLANLATAANTSALLMIVSLLFPSLVLIIGLGQNLFGRKQFNA